VWLVAVAAMFAVSAVAPRRAVWIFGAALAVPLAVAAWVTTKQGRG
jgi:hypothetical protein